MAKVMTNTEFIKRLRSAATDHKTLYVMGCFGAPMNSANKKRYTQNHNYNKAADRTAMINAASADTFGFDCVCLIKGILWGWRGDKNKTYGGAAYGSNGVPDIGADQMINVCSGVSTDFSNLVPGEAVWMKGHIGVYIGGGLAVECSPKWENKVQITACNCTKSGYNRRNWTKHGKLPYIDYAEKAEEAPAPAPAETFSAEGIDVSKWQGSIDFAKVKAAGKSFVIARAGIGLETDPYWEENYKKAKAAGLNIGAYWAHNNGSGDTAERALAEAKACIDLLKGKKLEFPVYYDLEVGDSSKWNAMAYAFCQTVEAAGYFVGLYTSESFLKNFDANFKTRFTLWVANWSKKPATGAIWQKSSKGSVPGISGDVDLDTAFQDFPTVIKGAKLNGYGSKVTEDEEGPTTAPTAPTEPSQPDPDKVMDLATRVIHGEFGNGTERKARLGSDYAAVQAEVNHRLTASIEDLAKEVIAGRYGNGQARKDALAYRYGDVQRRVNELLK